MSADGNMQGPATATSNAVICNPGGNFSVQQYNINGITYDSIVAHPTSGTTNMSCSQIAGVTVMTWTRGVNNGDPLDAQVVNPGTTFVIWAVGASNTFDSTQPHMGSTSVALMAFANSVTLNEDPLLVLNWNARGDTVDFQAVLTGTSWCATRLLRCVVCVTFVCACVYYRSFLSLRLPVCLSVCLCVCVCVCVWGGGGAGGNGKEEKGLRRCFSSVRVLSWLIAAP